MDVSGVCVVRVTEMLCVLAHQCRQQTDKQQKKIEAGVLCVVCVIVGLVCVCVIVWLWVVWLRKMGIVPDLGSSSLYGLYYANTTSTAVKV
jgi:hypothetical protein